MRILKEACPLPRETVSRAPATTAAFYMIQLRTHVLETTSPKFKLAISTESSAGTVLHPQPVKIIHR